jgi:flagellar basal body-associated protein FliL
MLTHWVIAVLLLLILLLSTVGIALFMKKAGQSQHQPRSPQTHNTETEHPPAH